MPRSPLYIKLSILNMRAAPKKILYILATLLFLLLLYNTVKTATEISGLTVEKSNSTTDNQVVIKSEVSQENNLPMKYILQWTSSKNVPFTYMGQGRQGFIDRGCPYTNCYVTGDKSFLSDITKFDAIAFSAPEVVRLYNLPYKRSPHQKYAFASIESSDYYPVCSNRFDNYFNWTWTFRLDSEVRWGYMTVRDENNKIVGPNKIMNWMKSEDMKPVSAELKEQLRAKSKAVAWFVSNCNTRSKLEGFVRDLRKELQKHSMDVDIYGKCGSLQCSRANETECDELIKKDYYFYLSFENSFSEDYATEKLLHALENTAIPIVYGGANYSRFMPDGIYLNARELGAGPLVEKMLELMDDPEKYSDYFKWKNHYSYHRKFVSVETEPYCLFCTTLNDDEMVKKTTIYKNFREWWDPPNRC